MASRLFASDRRYSMVQSVVDLFAEVVFAASTSAPTLTAAKSLGVKACAHASADSAAAGVGGSLYVLSLTDRYNRCLNVAVSPVGDVPTVNAVQRVGNGVGGGVGTVVCASATTSETLTINGVSYAFIANGASPSGNQIALGTDDAGTATAIAARLTALAPTGITARAVGTAVVIESSVAGASLYSSNATKLRCTTDAVGTANVPREMQPGLVLQTAVGVTATVPAGSTLNFTITLQNSSN